MKNVFLIHGFAGSPDENWFPWLCAQLEERGVTVTVPQFPSPATPVLEAWLTAVQPFVSNFDEETILVGHSLGATFILRLLEHFDVHVGAVYLVAGLIEDLHDPRFSPHITGFMETPFDWAQIQERAGEVHVFHSNDDPYVPLDHGQRLAKNLGATLHAIPNAGHFNTRSGYTKFPQLLTIFG